MYQQKFKNQEKGKCYFMLSFHEDGHFKMYLYYDLYVLLSYHLFFVGKKFLWFFEFLPFMGS